MARSRGKKGHTGASMGGSIVRIPRTGPLQRNNKSCPVCYSVARQPCRQVLSKPGAPVLRLGRPIPTMHRARSGKPAPDTPQQSRQRQTHAHKRAQEPVPIERLHPDRAGFVPKNLRDGRPLKNGWRRNNSDAIPRGTKP